MKVEKIRGTGHKLTSKIVRCPQNIQKYFDEYDVVEEYTISPDTVKYRFGRYINDQRDYRIIKGNRFNRLERIIYRKIIS